MLFNYTGLKEVLEVQVHCNNKAAGCEWTGVVPKLDSHSANCPFSLIPCPRKCKNTAELQLMKKDLEDHLKKKCPKRAHKCKLCGEKGTYDSITNNHTRVCVMKIIECPNRDKGCPIIQERLYIKSHVKECSHTEVSCPYDSLGCQARMLRKDLEKHKREAREEHMEKALESISSHEERNQTLSEGESFVFKVPGYSLKKENEMFYSKSFYTHHGGYKMHIRVEINRDDDANGTHLSVFSQIVTGRYDSILHWPFQGTITYQLLNQLADDRHYSKGITLNPSDNMYVESVYGCPKFLPHSSLGCNLENQTQYLQDDTLYFRVLVEVDSYKPWLVCTGKVNIETLRAVNDNKTLKPKESVIFKVTDFTTKSTGKDWFYSDSFYTSPSGYKMSVNVVPSGAGSGEGTHVAVYTSLLEGVYDTSLSWPFLGNVTITLLNQLSDDNHHTQVLEYDSSSNAYIGSVQGTSQFITHSRLSLDPDKNTQYLLKDTLYFRVSVEEENGKPWLTCTHH